MEGMASALPFDVTSVTVDETDGSVTFSVTRSGGSEFAAAVDVSTADGAAVAGEDFAPVAASLSWAAGELGTKEVVVPIVADDTDEGDETFTLVLAAAGVGFDLPTPTADITIAGHGEPPPVDDDLTGTDDADAEMPELAVTGPPESTMMLLWSGLLVFSGLFCLLFANAGKRSWLAVPSIQNDNVRP